MKNIVLIFGFFVSIQITLFARDHTFLRAKHRMPLKNFVLESNHIAKTPDQIADEVLSIIEFGKRYDYIGEEISQYEHAVQCAHQARRAGHDDETVIAALLHDIGHLCAKTGSPDMDGFGIVHHEDIGADFLRARGFSEKVVVLVRSHVQAKRYLVFKNPEYYNQISPASQETLKHQGGPMSAQEAELFEQKLFFQDTLNIRFCEERAKTVGVQVPEFESYRSLIVEHLKQQQQNRSVLPIKRAIVVGATSGIGRQVAKELAYEGYQVGLVGRREHLLKSLSEEILTKTYQARIDVSDHEVAADQLRQLIAQMDGLDLMVVSISSYNDISDSIQSGRLQNWDADFKTINVEAAGFYTAAAVALEIFEKQQSGHLVGISSLNALRGDARCPVYCAAKAFVSCYLEGIRNKMLQNNVPIYVTDILPGWVDTEQKKFSDEPGTYWVIPAEQAARDIVDAIKNKEKVRYVAKRQQLVAWALKTCPDWLYNWIGGF